VYQPHGRLCVARDEPPTAIGWWAEVRDLTASGLAVLLPRPVSPGGELMLDLPVDLDKPGRALGLRISACRPEDGRYAASCAFARPPSEDEWPLLGPPA
jgi:hypothetical protein